MPKYSLKNHVELSKFLSYVLRHKPEEIGITLDSEGWVDIDTLVQKSIQAGQLLTRDLIVEIAKHSDKQRFSISEDRLFIRAAQGHSTRSVNITYKEKRPPINLFHGTTLPHLNSILQNGLTPQARHYVHLSIDQESAIAVGKRHGEPVLLIINSSQMYIDGFKFFIADNGVWLTDYVPYEYINRF